MVRHPICHQIRQRREQLGLSAAEVAKRSRLTTNEYFDLEQHLDEAYSVVALYYIKKIASILSIDMFDLLRLKCSFCDDAPIFSDDFCMSIDELVRRRREMKDLSPEDLGDLLGYEGFEIKNVETYPAHLQSWAIDDILALASQLEIPAQVLLDLECSKCRH